MKQFRVFYDDSSDSFVLEINVGDEWDTSIIAPCMNRNGDKKNAPKLYVHCSILIEMQKLVNRGYTMVN